LKHLLETQSACGTTMNHMLWHSNDKYKNLQALWDTG
jgi:hypothetical protein